MSRKKVKKETVKRKTSIYDPMGVYGRGLTENQRLGMTRRMKIENIRNPEKNITKEDLEEYQKLLVFYGMYNRVRSGHVENIPLSYDFHNLSTFSNDTIMSTLNDMNIRPQFFVCDTIVIERDPDELWNTSVRYYINVGDSLIYNIATPGQVAIYGEYPSVTIPRWFIIGTEMIYFGLYYDNDRSHMYTSQVRHDFSGETQYADLLRLPNDGSPIPYLLYPNTAYPELTFSVGFDNPSGTPYYVTFNVLVIY